MEIRRLKQELEREQERVGNLSTQLSSNVSTILKCNIYKKLFRIDIAFLLHILNQSDPEFKKKTSINKYPA